MPTASSQLPAPRRGALRSRLWGFTKEKPGAGSLGGGLVGRIEEHAAFEGQAAAADAAGQPVAQRLEVGNALVQRAAPGLGQPLPVVPVGCSPLGKLVQRYPNLPQGETEELGGADDGNAP